MVFQGYTLFPWLTVKKNVMFGLRSRGMGFAAAEREALQWIDLVGLEKFADSYPGQLSGGMQQRVALARTLVNRPRILLMDEPFAALDAHTRGKMQSYLLEIWHNIDITVLFITHDLDEAIYLPIAYWRLNRTPAKSKRLSKCPCRGARHATIYFAEFLATRKHIDELIHPASEEDDKLNIIRLTRVGDEVEP